MSPCCWDSALWMTFICHRKGHLRPFSNKFQTTAKSSNILLKNLVISATLNKSYYQQLTSPLHYHICFLLFVYTTFQHFSSSYVDTQVIRLTFSRSCTPFGATTNSLAITNCLLRHFLANFEIQVRVVIKCCEGSSI